MPQTLQETPGRTCILNGKERLFFSGYAYLGVNHVDEFKKLVKEGIDKYGVVFPSSRISNTQLGLYGKFENLLSEITASESTACFSSGFLAGNATINLFDKIYNAPASHPAIKAGTAPSISFEEWTEEILNAINLSPEPGFVLAADAVNIITSTVNNFSFLKKINKPVTVIIDDSHSIGLINQGSRISAVLPKAHNIKYIYTYSLSKAFGIAGGAVSSDAVTIDQLRSTPKYTATTSVSPAFMHAFIHAQDIYSKQRHQLEDNIKYFQNLISSLNISFHRQLPVFILPEIDENKLLDKNVVISSFAYPDPAGKKVQRIIITALHTKNDLEYLASILKELLPQS